MSLSTDLSHRVRWNEILDLRLTAITPCGVSGLRRCIYDHPLAASSLLRMPILGSRNTIVFGPGGLLGVWSAMEDDEGNGFGAIFVVDWIRGLLLNVCRTCLTLL